jgi:riboflavin kinase/FMN adenylyltransferase
MQHIHSFQDIRLERSWVTIGSFDGVHLGHQAILREMVNKAHANMGQAVVVTFYPHPVVVLRGLKQAFYLTTSEERAQQFFDLGVDVVVTLQFDHNMAAMSAADFLQPMINHLGMQELWVGPDFALGRNRAGNIESLIQLGNELGYTVRVVHPVEDDQEKISSSRIRTLISQGDMRGAARQLGHWYTLSGPIVHGDGRGHRLGFPTANIQPPPERLLPLNGVYATLGRINGEWLPAVTNVGFSPTFKNDETVPRIEAYILDFKQDVYGQFMEVAFVEFLRPELHFNSLEELLEQIQRDIEKSREILRHVK